MRKPGLVPPSRTKRLKLQINRFTPTVSVIASQGLCLTTKTGKVSGSAGAGCPGVAEE